MPVHLCQAAGHYPDVVEGFEEAEPPLDSPFDEFNIKTSKRNVDLQIFSKASIMCALLSTTFSPRSFSPCIAVTSFDQIGSS